ncbi:MAG: MFS transporter [Firmicutes bacterium HGW-Firmicutes-16]|nr:MAG: MFS transporter [Firmicutes bacterium HGW-Firmicutes-16]
MSGKKYFWTLAAVYMCYLTLGIQAIVISQNLDKFAAQWSTDTAGVYNVIAYTGLARFLSVWICGELSNKIGRKLMIVIGAILYLAFFDGLLKTTSLEIAIICAFMGGLATSFVDGACYPAVQESWTKAPNSAVILIKVVISVSSLIYPLLVVSFRTAGTWQVGLIIPIVMSFIIFVLALIAPYSYDDELRKKRAKRKELKAAGKEIAKLNELDEGAQRAAARIVKKPPFAVNIGCILFGFFAMAIMYSAQQFLNRYGLTVAGMSDLKSASLTSLFTFGSVFAVIVSMLMMAKFRWRTIKILVIDLSGSVLAYVLLCTVPSDAIVQIAALAIGIFASGGALQCGVSLMLEFHPGNKARNLGLYYTFMGLASYTMPKIQSIFTKNFGEGQAILYSLLVNFGLAVVGVVFIIYLATNYKRWFGVSVFSKKADIK